MQREPVEQPGWHRPARRHRQRAAAPISNQQSDEHLNMAHAEELLAENLDPVLGSLFWETSEWVGDIQVGTHHVRLLIDLDEEDHSRERQIESIAYAKALLPKVLKNEAQLRRQAADEIAEAAGSEASEEDRRRYASEVDSAAAAMEPQVLCISFPDGGYLECRDATQAFYGASTVVIRFDDEGNYEEAEVDFE
ncbi:hypothetical protein EJO68_04115 [Variovorax atrisoli]|uniref:hypothetical protein n=1 Tax=Variovorax atrisoli TaxID=3394203 RepID=UPI000F7F679E|nr:hypothetical protein [Variovorax sp. 369]RTD98565.1 hypothetical protein EJO68_04115 [Variovorax sp. 369]